MTIDMFDGRSSEVPSVLLINVICTFQPGWSLRGWRYSGTSSVLPALSGLIAIVGCNNEGEVEASEPHQSVGSDLIDIRFLSCITLHHCVRCDLGKVVSAHKLCLNVTERRENVAKASCINYSCVLSEYLRDLISHSEIWLTSSLIFSFFCPH